MDWNKICHTRTGARRITIGAVFSIVILAPVMLPLRAQPVIDIDPRQFSLEMPHGVRESVVLNIANDGDEVLDYELEVRQPRRDDVLEVAVWTALADRAWEVPNIVASLETIEVGHHITEYRGGGADEVRRALNNSHVLVIVNPVDADEEAMLNLGDALSDDLWRYIIERRGFIVGTDQRGGTAAFFNGAALTEIEIEGRDYRGLAFEAVGLHPVNIGVPEYQATGGCNLHRALDDGAVAVAIEPETQLNNITAKQIEQGGLVYIGLNWARYSRQMTQLLVNSVLWARGGSTWLIPEEYEGSVQPEDSEDIIIVVDSRLTPEPGEYRLNLVIHSNDPQQQLFEVPFNLTVTDWSPAEIDLDPSEIFLITEQPRDTSLVVVVTNSGGGTLETDLSLDDPDMGWMSLNRNRLIIGGGLEDRLVVSFHAEQAGAMLNSNWVIFEFFNPELTRVELPVNYYANDTFGTLAGSVTDLGDGSGIEGAHINISGLGTYSGQGGGYRLERVPPARYTIQYSHPDFLGHTEQFVEIDPNEVTELDVELAYSQLDMDFEPVIEMRLPPGVVEDIPGLFRNNGTGSLNYRSSFTDLNPGAPVRPWQLRAEVASGEIAGAAALYGAVYTGEHYLTSGIDPDNNNMIFKISRGGELVEAFEQPVANPRGMFDLAWDGRLAYGSDRLEIIGFDPSGEVHARIPSPLVLSRAIAFDPSDSLLWVADALSPIYGINFAGDVIAQFENPELNIFGMAWLGKPGNAYRLYLLCRNGPSGAQFYRMNTANGNIQFVNDVSVQGNERACGASFSVSWDPLHWTMLSQFSGGASRTVAYNVTDRQGWVVLNPAAASVAPGGELAVGISFDTRGFNVGEVLGGRFIIDGGQRGGADTIRIALAIEPSYIEPDRGAMPAACTLDASPNPFNGMVVFNYTIPQSSPVKLSIFDITGRLVANLIEMHKLHGTHRALWRAGVLPAGLYIASLETPDEVLHLKMALVK